MTTPVWQPGTLYPPGSLVQPASAIPPTASPVVNGDFESGDVSWTKDAGWTIGAFGSGTHFTGTKSAQWDLTGTGRIRATAAFTVIPGQSITATAQVQQGASAAGDAGGRVEIGWYTAADALISYSSGNMIQNGSNQHWQQSSVTATAPATAAKARIVGYAFRTSGGDELWMDQFTWNLQVVALQTGLVFRATQALTGASGSIEPVWPLVVAGTVVDNQVTWEGVLTSRVVWEATPILVSGSSEPDFPALAGGTVADGTMQWTAMTARVLQAPNSRIVAIAASKVFAADKDIIPYCATVNCLDWLTTNDAGYIPFGLQTYGATDVSALALYRSNLVAFNSEGFQMWQVDEDPANIAILDAVPLPCQYNDTAVPVSNDLVFLTSCGVRSMGIAGANGSLQAGFFGQAVDPLVLAAIRGGEVPFALFYPAAGQYWLFFGNEAFVLTMTGKPADASWSRYVYPEKITAWCILGTQLYLRTDGEHVWRVDPDATQDDMVCEAVAPVLSAELITDEEIDLTWTNGELEDLAVEDYQVLRSVDGGAYAEIAVTSLLEFQDTDVDINSSGYAYKVIGRTLPAFTPDSNIATVGATGGLVVLYDVNDVIGWPGAGRCYSIDVDPVNNRLFFSAVDFTESVYLDHIKVWDIEPNGDITEVHSETITVLAGEVNFLTFRAYGAIYYPGASKVHAVRWSGMSTYNYNQATGALTVSSYRNDLVNYPSGRYGLYNGTVMSPGGNPFYVSSAGRNSFLQAIAVPVAADQGAPIATARETYYQNVAALNDTVFYVADSSGNNLTRNSIDASGNITELDSVATGMATSGLDNGDNVMCAIYGGYVYAQQVTNNVDPPLQPTRRWPITNTASGSLGTHEDGTWDFRGTYPYIMGLGNPGLRQALVHNGHTYLIRRADGNLDQLVRT